ncbi:hypothetical protein KP509_09G011500 [Ceratopteris richardii]|nr:hypothetical protein KP509_09G011500 [Ceratopteris richardii]
MAGADRFINTHRTIETEVVVPTQQTLAFTATGSQKTIANAVSVAVVRSKLHRCRPQYESSTELPKVGEKLQQQNLTTALKGESVASSAGRRGVKPQQVKSLDEDCISSGNSSGDHHHHQQDKEVNDLAAIDHMYEERRRRKRQRECLGELRKLVPNIRKRDKVTVLEHTIMFIEELQCKADELARLYSLKDELLASDLG